MIWSFTLHAYEWIISVINAIDKMGYPIIVRIPLMYGFLLFCLTALLAVYDGFVIAGLSKALDFSYELSRRNRSLSAVRLLSEWYYLFDKFLYVISPHLFKYRVPSYNVFGKSDKYSPIVIYRTLRSLVINMFTVSMTNLVVWSVIATYFYPTAAPTSYSWIRNLTWDKVYSAITQFEYKRINDFISFIMLVSSLMILLWLSSSSFKWRAMKKVNEEKYEKVIRHQETIENELWKIRSMSHDNIAKLNQMIEYLPNKFGEVITHTNNYMLEKNELKRKSQGSWGRFSYSRVEELYSGYKSFQDHLQTINNVLKDISDSKMRYVYVRVNKCVRYETILLSLFVKASLDYELIEGDCFRQVIENKLKDLEYLSSLFKKLDEVSSGWLNKEEFVEEYNKHGGSIAYESIVRYAENDLKRELLSFRRSLHEKFEDAILYHIILEQYLELSHRNTRFNFLQIISNFITK